MDSFRIRLAGVVPFCSCAVPLSLRFGLSFGSGLVLIWTRSSRAFVIRGTYRNLDSVLQAVDTVRDNVLSGIDPRHSRDISIGSRDLDVSHLDGVPFVNHVHEGEII